MSEQEQTTEPMFGAIGERILLHDAGYAIVGLIDHAFLFECHRDSGRFSAAFTLNVESINGEPVTCNEYSRISYCMHCIANSPETTITLL